MTETVYLDTSIFIEITKKGSKRAKEIRELLKDFKDRKVRVYTSILTVQELGVAAFRRGTIVSSDLIGDISKIARPYTINKEVALTAAKIEAQLKDIADAEASKRDPNKPLTWDQEVERICENRRRKWDCIHIATAQVLLCSILYSTDKDLQKRPGQLGIRDLRIIPPEATRFAHGPLLTGVEMLPVEAPTKAPTKQLPKQGKTEVDNKTD